MTITSWVCPCLYICFLPVNPDLQFCAFSFMFVRVDLLSNFNLCSKVSTEIENMSDVEVFLEALKHSEH